RAAAVRRGRRSTEASTGGGTGPFRRAVHARGHQRPARPTRTGRQAARRRRQGKSAFDRGASILVALGTLDRHDEAIASSDRALALRRELATAWCNRGIELVHLGRLEPALKSYARALAEFAKNWKQRSLSLLQWPDPSGRRQRNHVAEHCHDALLGASSTV